MSDCKKAKKLISGYIDGVLKEGDIAFFKKHIASCKECRKEYEAFKKILKTTASLNEELPEGFSRRLHTALVNEQFKEEKNAKKPFVFPYAKATSALLAVMVIAFVGKAGIYDTYKKVINDNQTEVNRIAEENNTPEVNEVAPVEENKGTQNPNFVQSQPTHVPTVIDEIPAGEISPAFEQVQAPEDSANPMARTVDEPAPASLEEVGIPADSGEVASYMSEEISNENQTPEDAPNSETIEEPKEAATALIPAQVKIYSGDGNMIMMKKFLLTFLSPEEIEEGQGEIVITVEEAEFEKVVTKLGENEYVKEVIPGTAFEGIGKIYIR